MCSPALIASPTVAAHAVEHMAARCADPTSLPALFAGMTAAASASTARPERATVDISRWVRPAARTSSCPPHRLTVARARCRRLSELFTHQVEGAEQAGFVAEKLSSVGYATHFIGKGHLGSQTVDHMPVNRGFATHVGYLNGAENYHFGCASYSDQQCSADPAVGKHDLWDGDAPAVGAVPTAVYSADYYTARAVELIAAHPSAFLGGGTSGAVAKADDGGGVRGACGMQRRRPTARSTRNKSARDFESSPLPRVLRTLCVRPATARRLRAHRGARWQPAVPCVRLCHKHSRLPSENRVAA